MPKANLGDLELYYEIHGKGPTLLLVAGLGGTGAYWKPQLAAFSKHFQVMIHDHRGTGQSTRSDIQYSVEQMTDDLLRLMDHLRIERAHIVGHSTGGAIGQIMALDHPDRVSSLVLYATWTKCDPFMRRIFETRKTLLLEASIEAYIKATAFFLFPDWWINENSAQLDASDAASVGGFPSARIAASRCDAVMTFDRKADLGKIVAPTLVFCAEDDFLTPAYFSRELAQLVPNAEFVTLARGGHACSQTVPESFNDAVLPFLMRRKSSQASDGLLKPAFAASSRSG
jgi:aminoacrylate hydrolase